MPSSIIGIVGIDGYTPTYEPQAKWTVWSIHEIYRGTVGQNKFVPKVNDYVIEPETFTTYIVTSLDDVTFVPNLSLIKPFGSNFVYNEKDVLLGPGDDSYRAYVDKSVYPYTLQVDSTLHIYGSDAQVARIYRGTEIDETKIVSNVYDNSNNLLGHDVPLELVAFNTHDNYAIKTVRGCSTIHDLQDGEILTVVIYAAGARVVSKRGVIVTNTTYVARAYNEQKYITNIALETPFVSLIDPNVINYPVNLPIESFNPVAVIQYNDGSKIHRPVDNTVVSLYGLAQTFTSTIIGHKVPLVLSYKLQPNEATVTGLTSDYVYVTKPYDLVVSEPNASYNVKLFIYPVWVSTSNSYYFKAYLMNLDRNILFDVTSLITLANNSPSFMPNLYGVTQRLTFRVNLKDVSSIFNYFIYTQVIDIVLRAPATDTSHPTPWEVGMNVPSTIPNYGTDTFAVRNTYYPNKLRLNQSGSDFDTWLTNIYIKTQPLVNPSTETTPIAPTHMKIIYKNTDVIVPITDYNIDITLPINIDLYDNVYVLFMKQTATGYLLLSIAGMVIR